MNDIAGFVLAGGQSSRMGVDKAFIQWQGSTLLQRSLDLLSGVAPRVAIVGPAQKFSAYGTVVEDQFLGRGPLAGIHAALRSPIAADFNLIVAVDIPLLSEAFLRFLLEQAVASRSAATVPRTSEGWQPLCAVYRREFAELADAALRLGRNKIDPLFADLELRVIQDNELRNFSFSPDLFRNINTPEDLQHAGGTA
ncbi:MAG TPA: molybdenum cofactor guanylyltransferase [Bryobacteraceae bacterium]